MKKENIIILALIIALVFLLCNSYQGETNRTTTKIQTTTDTITKTDTIRINSIQIKEKLVYQAITRVDTIKFNDTIRIPIPITTHTWKDTLYKIQVEGYKVRPLKIEIFPKTKYIHQTKTITNTIKPRKINFGIIAGYGIMLTPQKTPTYGITIGVGISYRLW